MTAYGVDGCKAGWFFICIERDDTTFGTVVHLSDLVDAAPADSNVFVDIPIGLRDRDGCGRLPFCLRVLATLPTFPD